MTNQRVCDHRPTVHQRGQRADGGSLRSSRGFTLAPRTVGTPLLGTPGSQGGSPPPTGYRSSRTRTTTATTHKGWTRFQPLGGERDGVVIQVKVDPNSDIEHRHSILNDFVIPEAKALPGFQCLAWREVYAEVTQ